MFLFYKSRIKWLSVMVLLGGCATYDPNDHYDPNAVEKFGLISSKSVKKIKYTEKPRGNFLPIPINGRIQMIYVPAESRSGYKDIYEYVVTISESKTVSVLDTYPGFEIGDCVKVFLSQKKSYPRIASGNGCIRSTKSQDHLSGQRHNGN